MGELFNFCLNRPTGKLIVSESETINLPEKIC